MKNSLFFETLSIPNFNFAKKQFRQLKLDFSNNQGRRTDKITVTLTENAKWHEKCFMASSIIECIDRLMFRIFHCFSNYPIN